MLTVSANFLSVCVGGRGGGGGRVCVRACVFVYVYMCMCTCVCIMYTASSCVRAYACARACKSKVNLQGMHISP